MNPERLQEIRDLCETYGDSTDRRWTPAFLALQDLLAELDHLTGERGRQQADVLAEVPATCPLTKQQLMAVVRAANGDSVAMHAAEEAVAPRTIQCHRQLSLRRLHALSISHAVAIGLAEGWISPELINVPRRWS